MSKVNAYFHALLKFKPSLLALFHWGQRQENKCLLHVAPESSAWRWLLKKEKKKPGSVWLPFIAGQSGIPWTKQKWKCYQHFWGFMCWVIVGKDLTCRTSRCCIWACIQVRASILSELMFGSSHLSVSCQRFLSCLSFLLKLHWGRPLSPWGAGLA